MDERGKQKKTEAGELADLVMEIDLLLKCNWDLLQKRERILRPLQEVRLAADTARRDAGGQ